MNFPLRAALLAAPLLLSLTSVSEAAFHGQYTLTFFDNAAHSQAASQCIKFVHTGTVQDFPNSGTWSSPTYSDWGGNFLIDHGNLRFYGTYSSGTAITNFSGQFKNGGIIGLGYDEWYPTVQPITPNTDGVFTLVPGCSSAAAAVRHSQAKSPSHY